MNRNAWNGLRRKLMEERYRLHRQVADLRAAWRPEELQTGGDNTPLSEEADAAQAIEERETGTRRLDWLVDRADGIGRALRRLDDGTYGVCESCGGPIAPERLAAIPEATLCVDCAAEQEDRHPDAVKRQPVLDGSPLD